MESLLFGSESGGASTRWHRHNDKVPWLCGIPCNVWGDSKSPLHPTETEAFESNSNILSKNDFGLYLTKPCMPILAYKQFACGLSGRPGACMLKIGLRYKLHMMGVPISGLSYKNGDSMSVIHNMQCLESTLKKKSNKICYHAIHKSVAMGGSRTGHVATGENPANLATKIIMSQPK